MSSQSTDYFGDDDGFDFSMVPTDSQIVENESKSKMPQAAREVESASKTISHTTQPPQRQEAIHSNGKAPAIPQLSLTMSTTFASGPSSTAGDVKLHHKNEDKDRQTFFLQKHSSRGLESASRTPGTISLSTSVKQDAVLLQNVVRRRGTAPSTPTKVRGPVGMTPGSSRFTPSSKFPVPISISDSESDENDVQILSATDSTVVSTQEASVIFDVPPGSKQTSLSSMGSLEWPVQRKRSSSDSLDYPRATKAARTHGKQTSTAPVQADAQMTSDRVSSIAGASSRLSYRDFTLDGTCPRSVLEDIMDPLELNVVELCHNTEAQRLFDDPKTRVGWGTQFLLARGVLNGRWKWIDVIQKIDQLSGTDSQKLHLVAKIMLNQDQGFEDAKIGQELDREQEALVENKGRGLGLLNEGTDWFGGKIQFIASLEKKGDDYGFQLEPIEMKRSHRFARMFGSRRFLQIKLGRLYLSDRDGVKAFLSQKFVLNGRVFVTIPPTKDTLYAFEINENYRRQDIPELGDRFRWSLGKFLDWHNPIELNGHQPLSKYFSRTGLGFSKSVPALEFHPQNILDLNDVLTDDVPPGKAPAEKTLTDGCGFINFAALSKITENLGYKSTPSAIQGRIAGAKGLWILHPDDGHSEPKIWIRNSQRKIKYEKLDRAHCIFDLLKTSQPSSKITLSSQTVVNLSHNGVPHSVFKELMKSGIEELVRALTAWGSDCMDMPNLWHVVGHTSGTPRSRLARLASDMSRALGYASREPESLMEQSAVEISEQESASSSGNGRNPYSGTPNSLGETVMEMLQAGFHPNECPQLVDKIKSVIRNALDKVVEKCHIPLPEGTGFDGFAIPDPVGVLEPGEVYYRSSTGYIDPVTKMMQFTPTGKVLIGRYPVLLPSDIQKVTFVDKPELVKWQDVIVISTKPIVDKRKGKVGGMSILSGGDFDGDTLFAIQLPELVNPFQNKVLSYPTKDVEINFERNVAVASQFVALLQAKNKEEAQRRFQHTSFSGLADHRLGNYNSYASAAARRYGYGSDGAIRLTYIFNTLMDGGKTGLVLKTDVYLADQKAHAQNKLKPQPRYIIDVLKKFGEGLRDVQISLYEQNRNHLSRAGPDPDLKRPHDDLLRRLNDPDLKAAHRILEKEFGRLKAHVDQVYEEYRKANQEAMKGKFSSEPNSPSKKSREKAKNSGRYRSVIQLFHNHVEGIKLLSSQDEVQFRASYAYTRCPGFAFHVAFQTLCELKAKSTGDYSVSTRVFDELKSMGSSARKLFKSLNSDH